MILLFISKLVFSQESSSSFWQNRCDFSTSGGGKALGVKIKLSVPCAWQAADGDRPHVVKKFINSSDGNTIAQTIAIYKREAPFSKAEIDKLFSQQGLKELSQDLGKFVAGRRIKIDGLESGEITFKTTRETAVGTLHSYSLQYYILFKDKIIILLYGVVSKNEKKAKELFDGYQDLFRGLAGSTVVLSQWE